MFNNTIRLCLLLIFILEISSIGYGQSVNFEDGFEDGNFTENPVWSGDDSLYTITLEEENHLLQLNGNSGDNPAYLSAPSTSIVGSWEFYIKLDFSPSDGNRADVFLMSDTPNLTGPVNGYALRAGENGSEDVFHLVRYDNGSETETVLSGTTDISGGGTFRIKVSRTSNGEWTLEVAGGYDGILSREGNTETDNTHISSSYFGVRSTYTSTRSDKFFFDFKIDLPPFTISKTEIIDNEVVITFNRPYDQTTIQTTDFSINNEIGAPVSISYTDSETVTLLYNDNFPSGEYILTIDNISDLNGETITNTTDSFIVFGNFATGDVIINEFIYDPPSDLSEYIELKNTSDKYLNIQNWVVGDENSTISISNEEHVLKPQEFLVLSSDTASLFNIFGTQAYVQLWSLPALNNTGDAIKLISDEGDLADSLYYTSAWGGEDIALERQSDSTPAIYKENWGNSPASLGGTPGQPNQILADTQPPALTQLNILSDNTLQLAFDERINSSAQNSANYEIDNISINTATSLAPDTVELALSSALTNAWEYQLKLSGIEDIFGNTINRFDTTFTYYKISSADSGDVYISEFMYAPPEESPEFVELHNSTNQTFDLRGWTLNDNTGNLRPITYQQALLPPDGFIVLTTDSTLLDNYPDISMIDMASRFPVLNNNGDTIVLRDSSGTLLDSLQYSQSWNGQKVSVERRTPDLAAVYPENWGEAPNGFGTPGKENQIEMDITPPDIAELTTINNQALQVIMTEQVNKSSAEEISNFSISDELGLESARFSPPDTINISLTTPTKNNATYTISIDGVRDLFGNTLLNRDTTFTYYEISSADSGDVYISEFMFAPPEESPEYIELHNPTDKTLNLNGWTLNDNTGTSRPITYYQTLLPPNEFIVLTADSTLSEDYPDISMIDMASRFPVLNNNGDAIVLRDSSGTLLDSLKYSQSWGKKEIALERRTEELSAEYKENWGNAPNDFGTPGQPNEIGPDVSPPLFTDLSISGVQTISLAFTETLVSASVNDVAHYSLSTDLEITNTSHASHDSVELTISDSLRNNTNYTLTVTGLSDLFGNVITEQDTSFTYFSVSSADSGDVFINEFMPDPPDEYSEYIELYNPTSYSFNIQDWSINDNTGNLQTITNEKYIIPPDSFVVIAPDQSLLNHYNNIPLLQIGNRFPALNNSGDNIVLRDSSGTLLDSLQYSGLWNESQQSLERRSQKLSAVYQANWGYGETGLGSPGYKNTVSPDTQAPALFSFHITGPNSLQLSFDEWIDAASLEGSFSFAKTPQIADTRFLPPDTVNITLSDSLQNATSYTLEIAGINDLFGNIRSSIDTTFTYFEVSPADSGQIFINEFSYNPAPGQTEYIEIYNSTNRSFDLKEWTLNDNRGTPIPLTPEKLIFPPKSYTVLAPDNTLLNEYPDINLVEMGNQFPALNNSGDDIVFKTRDGTVLDSLQYTSSWSGDETGLERKTTTVSGTFRENWGPAPDDGGSPGRPNNIPKDQEPPKLIEIYPIDASKVHLIFSESITAASATNFENYKISPARDIQLVSVKSDSVTLFLSESLSSGQIYEVTVSNISDIFENSSISTSQEIEYLHLEAAVHNDIVINEIMHVPASDQVEFIELYNRSDKNIDLTNWSFGDAKSEATISESIQLRTHSYLTISGNTTFAQANNNAVSLGAFPNLNNAGDALFIKDSAGKTIDSLYYQASWGENREGYSLERKDPHSASNDVSNWQTNTSENGNSAGIRNISFQKDSIPPKLIFANVRADNQIEVHFDEFIKMNSEIQFTIDGQPLSLSFFESSNANKLLLQELSSELKGTDLKLTVSNFSDFRGNVTGSDKVSVAQPVHPKDLIINEIMFNPINDPEDNQADQSEYVELYNTQDYALSLEGIIFHDAPDEKGEVQALQPVSTTAKWVLPHETILIYADQIQNFEQSKLADFYDLKSANMQDIIRIDRSSLSLASSNDAIYITDSLGAVIDSVHYSDEWHNPNLIDTKGIALERISPGGPTNTPSNWSSSVEPKGGTPKAQNSIYQKQPQTPQETGITFTPNPFSPDGDGYEDKLIISYKLDQSDYLLRVNIFDRYGRHIKELADGTPAGFEGTLIWDGRRNGESRNRIGIYIIVFEAYDSSSGKNKAFKKTVVIARKLN